MSRYQIVWWPTWRGVRFERSTLPMAYVYDWYLHLGPLEIRRWSGLSMLARSRAG